MPYHWERPTERQRVRGIIAVYVLTHYQFIDSKDVSLEMPCPYRAINIERRIKRGGALPYWITIGVSE